MKKFFAALFLLLITFAAVAQPYAVGTASIGVDQGTTNGFSIGAGYRLARYVAIEAAYNDLPRSTESSTSISTASSQTWEGYSLSISAIGYLPLARELSMVGRLGAHRVSADVRSSEVTYAGSPPVVTSATDRSSSESFWAPAVGLGLQLDLGRYIGRLMYEQLKADSTARPRDLRTVLLSVGRHF